MIQMKNVLFILLCCCASTFVSAQSWQDKKVPASQSSEPFDPSSFRHADLPWIETLTTPERSHTLLNSQVNRAVFDGVKKSDPARTIWSESQDRSGRSLPQTRKALLDHLTQTLPALNQQTDLVTQEITADELGMTHHFLQQYFEGLPVFGAQLTLHESAEGFLRMNGRLFNVAAQVPEGKINENDAKSIVKDDLRSRTVLMDTKSLAMQLLQQGDEQREILYFDDTHNLHRAWQIKYIPNIYENWEYIVDASSGEILNKWNNICRIHDHDESKQAKFSSQPPSLGSGLDLNGANLEVRCYDDNGTFFLLDASREMFKSLGTADLPPQGAILTYDTKNKPIDEETGFFPNELISSSDANAWDAKAVSAHVNAGIAYEYYRQLLQRNSINGSGGSIYSFINIADPEKGGDFDQAFWNEKIIFYGNGKDVFNRPLQAALDVAAHEMSHGVIQNSANLIYQGESGALNEAIADFFAVATEARLTNETDVIDWKIGNDIINTSIYRSGALRDLSNPHNGGTSLNSVGYQPQFYSERFTGRADNGGVHINSGIANHAFYLVTESVGLQKAEQIIYRSLTTYLTRSSNFQDLRNAMVAAASDLHGVADEVRAVNDAFDFVEIVGGVGAEAPMEADANPGSDLILATSTLLDQSDLYQLANQQLVEIQSALIEEGIINPPSVTDDGAVILYVTDANEIKFISIDYTTGDFEGDVVSTQAIWRNAVISRDGTKIAALTTENDNMVWIFDLISGDSKQFELFNPTFTEGVSTGNVEFADAMDFDFSGELLMYDASNLITSTTSEEFSYWDIGFIEVFDNEAEAFADGDIFKLVTGLPDNVSIGNPVFSKNSPNIIALDYIEVVSDGTTEYSILGVNIETGESDLIHEIVEQGGTLGYPTFSRSDQTILFNAMSEDDLGQPISVVKAAFLAENKIGMDVNSQAVTVIENHRWPVWFSNGERMLTGVFSETSPELNFEFYPNPVVDQAQISVEVSSPSAMHLRITDLLGRTVLTQRWPVQSGSLKLSIDGIREIGVGVYFGEFRVGKDLVGFKMVVGR